ncbi:hypothetical protein HELRODRAFT_115799 [Helobdella robusta]|uniref:FERM domain-containing protein n=1 Tax=Helobdella robusta TaxID=6412 RepID=T1EGA6_HELRO|nr:hypothetical protein HELRODRAFT_115799 [Helobdella robusta]ESN92443.1 hypothetical protein HELRODRAFT_115799 [Helobdella robusta]
MATLTLKINVVDCCVTKTINFDPTTIVYDACRIIREKVPESTTATHANANDYGLFYTEENKRTGIWLESGKSFDHYMLRNGDLLEYKKKIRTLRVRMLDDSVKTLFVDDSQNVSQVMLSICSKIGITNHDEYSLVRDLPDSEKEKTLTMKRDKSIAKNQKKLDEMKKKLHTDDELDWLDHNKSLREQGVDEKETLLLRRKYFFSDQNVDARDPIQLHLLYVQTRDTILKGALPVTQDQAIEFAGLQCQVQHGDYDEKKHKPGFLDLKEVLPKEYCRVKGIEKKIYLEQKKLSGFSEIESKAKYTQLARSLPTYGIAFFLVKEKVKGKNKLTPSLLGITKESVVKIDEKKEVVKTWPLTTVKRWAASPNTFTLDFGDYADSYYCVQTMEGEQIAQLIAGYIDIIMKKKQTRDHLGLDGDEESTMYEDSVSPAKATIIQHQSVGSGQASLGSVALPAILRSGETANGHLASNSMQQQAQFSKVSLLAHAGYRLPAVRGAQRALLGRIGAGLTSMKGIQNDLETKGQVPQLGTDPASIKWRETAMDNSRQRLSAQLSAMNAATAQVVMLTRDNNNPDSTDYSAVGSAVQTISANLNNFSQDVRMLAAMEENEKEGTALMGAARLLVGAFSDLLIAVQPKPRQNILNAANRVGEASQGIMLYVEPCSDEENIYKEKLMTSARAVATATANLVLQAKNVSARCKTKEQQSQVIETATQCALASSQLVACSRVVMSTIDNASCQDMLVEAAKMVAKSVDDVVTTSQEVCDDEPTLANLNQSATVVTETLDNLMQHVKRGTMHNEGLNQVDTIMITTDRLCNSVDNTQELVKQARQLAQATSYLVNSLKVEADQQNDSDRQNKLLSAAKMLADATARMVEAAKGCASQPQDEANQRALKVAADELRSATTTAAVNALKQPILTNLQQTAKNATSAATQLINAATASSPYSTNQQTHQQLIGQCNSVSDDVIPKLVQALRTSHKRPEDPKSLSSLIDAVQEFIAPCNKLLTTTKAALPMVTDESCSICLNGASKNLTSSLADLRSAVLRAQQACTAAAADKPEIELALDQVKSLERELMETKQTALSGKLMPLPGDTTEMSCSQLGAASKAVATAMAQLLTAATQGSKENTGSSACDVAKQLKNLSRSVRGVASTTSDQDLKMGVIDRGIDVIQKSGRLIEDAKSVAEKPNDVDAKNRLAMVRATKVVSQSLSSCVNCLPGLKDIDAAARKVSDAELKLNKINQVASEVAARDTQQRLNQDAANLNKATSDLLQACQNPNNTSDNNNTVASSANQLSKIFEGFIDDGVKMAAQTKDSECRHQIVEELRNVTSATNKFLAMSKSIVTDPSGPSAKNLLTQAARAVTDSINKLIGICTESSPGQKECDGALREMQMLKPLLHDPNQPVNKENYFECLDNVIDKSKVLAESMTSITACARQQDMLKFCTSVDNFSKSVCSIVESSVQAAYIVGISDPNSEPIVEGLVDQDLFLRASETTKQACDVLGDRSTNQAQMLAAVSTIAHQTSLLCNACRQASSKTTNPVAKRQFVQSAKDLANNTAQMVKSMKVLGGDQQQPINVIGHDASKPLLQSLDVLNNFALVPEFVGTPAKIGQQGRAAQQPLMEAAREIVDGACEMVSAAKQLAVKPNDQNVYQAYSTHSHTLSEAMKKMVTSMRITQPGHKECDWSIDQINLIIHDIDQISLAAVSHDPMLASMGEGRTLEACHEQVINSAKQMLDLVEPIKLAAKGESGNLGHLVNSAISYMTPFKMGLLGCVAKTTNSKVQMDILEKCKTVAEALQNLITCARDSGGNKKASPELQAEVDDAATETADSIKEIIDTMEKNASSSGVVSSLLANLNESVTQMDEEIKGNTGELSFVEHQTNIVAIVKQLAKTSQEMLTRSVTDNAQDLGALANNITRDYAMLVEEGKKAYVTCPNEQMGNRIKVTIQQLGKHCIGLVQNAGSLQCNPNDSFAKKELGSQAKKVIEDATDIMTILQSSARGTQACITAISTMNGIMADLDTTIMFASAGTLSAESADSFSNYREGILKMAKELVEDTKTLVSGAALNQDQLAGAATKSVTTINNLSECVKRGATSLGSNQPDAQVSLLNAVKDVVSALTDLIGATKVAAGKPPSDPSMVVLKDAAKTMVTNVTNLLKTVKTVEDEATRGTQALESSIEAIQQELKAYAVIDRFEKAVSPDSIIQITRPITMATSKAVAAGNSGRQDDIIAAANLGRKAISDLLKHCKGGVVNVEDRQLKQRMLDAGNVCAHSYRELLINIQQIHQKPITAELKQQLAMTSKKVAQSVTEIVHAAEAIKGMDWFDPQDPSTIAENELLSAANAIEAAAKKLASLQPRLKPKQVDDSLNFEEQLLEAAKSIAAATAALVKAASVAQRELVMQDKLGKVSSDDYDTDSQWSQGLISAARMVAAATQSLCDAANAMVQGQASEEKLISSAKQVAASTAQLLIACKVKADPNSQAMHRLQNAGHAVKKATEILVMEAQKMKNEAEDEESVTTVNNRMVTDMAQIIMAQEEILRKEKELEMARKKLETIRKAKYRPTDEV